MSKEEEDEEGEEKESTEALDSKGNCFKKLVLDWNGPDHVYTKVTDWILAPTLSENPTPSHLFQFCFTFSENLEEDYELKLWMLNLVAHYVAEDESWLDEADVAKDWSSLTLLSDWEILPPLWARRREEEELKRITGEENSKKAEESLDCVTTSPFDSNWGIGLPAPTPTVAVPSTPLWRPWAEEHEAVNFSLVKRKKRRSPAAAARSQLRLQQWQERVDKNRLDSELRSTPLRSVEKMRGTRLLGRLESQEGGEIHTGAGGCWVEGRSVFFSNHSQTSMLPQPFQSPMSTHAPVMYSPSSHCGIVATFCPACHAWGLLTPG